ncbi:ABC transporter permease [Corynebacterium sp. NPDC060344]|uniref:ABC transporter permease n=1 Tax=Corynebacterium sp. NPDC060344 TaxID=3347101 RepID=UPI0036509CFD
MNKYAYSLTPYLGALLEAWHELRINRNRIMLSLVSVAAAVWAMSTVIALGNILTSSSEAATAQSTGIAGTVTITASPGSGIETNGGAPDGSSGGPMAGFFPPSGSGDAAAEGLDVVKPDGSIDDAFSGAARATVDQVRANTWTRMRTQPLDVLVPGKPACDPVLDPTCVPAQVPDLYGVDPGWFDIHRRTIIEGRALQPGDGERLMNPTVVNEALWEQLGFPDPAAHPTFTGRETGATQFTVVGVMKGLGTWDSPLAVTSYDSLMYAGHSALGSPRLLVAAPLEEAKQAQRTMTDMMRGHLGGGWQISGSTADRSVEQTAQMNSMITKVLGVIGGIVIALGALGLLTVSIVTIGHRVREIGIRRAMGASAARIFISVFLESIVATTVAGVVGVVLSIVTVKQLPLEAMLGMPIDLGTVPYPLTAAFMGVAIASLVGALAGVIPATIAVRVKPIDAIRF